MSARRTTSSRNSTRIGHELKPLDIVLVNTAAGVAYGATTMSITGCGMGREATLYLTERGVRVTGIDGWSWDAPFFYTAQAHRGDRRLVAVLGGPQGRPRDRLLPYREAAQSRGAAADHGFTVSLLPGEGREGVRRLDAGGGDFRLNKSSKQSGGDLFVPSKPRPGTLRTASAGAAADRTYCRPPGVCRRDRSSG